MSPPQVATDIAAGVAHLRGRGRARAVFTVGFCFGGSYSFLQAANGDLGLSGVIGFYGGMRPRTEGGDSPITVAPRSQVPVLGLFGGADESIPTELVEQFRAGLVDSGVAHSVHVYPGAPHSFFDRSYAEHGQECADAWRRMLDFLSAHAPARNTT
jgi:carboxymethylenebutenolidase